MLFTKKTWGKSQQFYLLGSSLSYRGVYDPVKTGPVGGWKKIKHLINDLDEWNKKDRSL